MMSRRRKNRRNADEQPVQAPAAPTSDGAPDEVLKALTDRLAALEKAQAPGAPWTPLNRHRSEHAAWIATNTRTDHTDPCPACGLVGGEQRRTDPNTQLLPMTWLCTGCVGAVEIGWGTNSRSFPSWGVSLDRLAATAAGMAEPTPGFRTLASRYGLTFALARDNQEHGDGTTWGHLDRPQWLEVGVKATKRAQAGFGELPFTTHPEHFATREVRREFFEPFEVIPPGWPAGKETGRWMYEMVEKRVHIWPDTDVEITPEIAARWLRDEEAAVDQALKDQVRAAKERGAQAERDRREEEIRAHYRDHVAELEEEIRKSRALLRNGLDQALARHAERGM